MHKETVTTNREIVANHLAYTHLYMFLVAEYLQDVFDNCEGCEGSGYDWESLAQVFLEEKCSDL